MTMQPNTNETTTPTNEPTNEEATPTPAPTLTRQAQLTQEVMLGMTDVYKQVGEMFANGQGDQVPAFMVSIQLQAQAKAEELYKAEVEAEATRQQTLVKVREGFIQVAQTKFQELWDNELAVLASRCSDGIPSWIFNVSVNEEGTATANENKPLNEHQTVFKATSVFHGTTRTIRTGATRDTTTSPSQVGQARAQGITVDGVAYISAKEAKEKVLKSQVPMNRKAIIAKLEAAGHKVS
jgi:formylmethanofuran dehydrogenase subunit E-like metal-binding protein